MNNNNHIENSDEYKGLRVNKGVNNALSINPNIKNQIKRNKFLSADEYVAGILKGDINCLSKSITLSESLIKEHQNLAQEIINKCLPSSGKSIRIGFTGVPGVGKSTIIEALGVYLINKGHKVAVLAVDPSSQKTKGSILGDKTRMEQLSTMDKAFIRPSPSSGTLGGVARKTREAIFLCEAAGFDVIFVETVGVGQSETAVHSMVDFFLLLMLAGAGDELQGIKRGIMEMADAIVINKADGNNIFNANIAKSNYENALHLFPQRENKWRPKVILCSALENKGIDELWDIILGYKNHCENNKFLSKNRLEQSVYAMYEEINNILTSNFYNNNEVKLKIKDIEKNLIKNKFTSYKAAEDIVDFYSKTKEE